MKRMRCPMKQWAEWNRASLVLLAEPSMATLFGSLTPSAVNFTSSFSLRKAQKEHQSFREELESRGIEVIEVRELLSSLKEEDELEELLRTASKSLEYYQDQMHDRVRETIKHLQPPDLVDLLFLRPAIQLHPSKSALDKTTEWDAVYRLFPTTNHYFMRDPLMTTARGVVLCNLQLEEREAEIEIVELVLSILGIKPLCKVEYPGRVEGGDFLPAGDFVLQGQGLLTNQEGVRQLLEAGAYGEVEVAVVKDPVLSMEAMHLDTYFNLLSSDLAIIQRERMLGPSTPEVDIYRPEESDKTCYRFERSMSFPDYLLSKGIELIEISANEQRNFASNFLLLGERDLIGVAGAGEEYFKRLEGYGVKVTPLDFSALTKGYGGPHCMSQVLCRER